MKSQLQVPFIYWNKNSPDMQHLITSVAVNEDLLVTGSESGELCIWGGWEPRLICALPGEHECRCLTFMTPPSSFLGSSVWVLSIHSDNILRAWDVWDGRCMSVSSESMLPLSTRFDVLHTMHERMVAVAGEIPDVLLIDAWAMEQVACFSLKETVAGISSGGFKSLSKFFAVDVEGNLCIWNLPDLREYVYNKENLPPINSEIAYDVNLESESPVLGIEVSADIIIVLYKYALQFIHKSWFKNKHRYRARLTYSNAVVSCKVLGKYIYVLLKSQKALRYSLNEALECLGVFKNKNVPALLQRTSSFTDMREFNMDQLSFSCAEVVDPLDNPVFFQHHLLTTQGSSVLVKDLRGFSEEDPLKGETYSFLLKRTSAAFFADHRIQHKMALNENITHSSLVLDNQQAYYLVGTNKGNIIVCPVVPSSAVQTFAFHTCPITCIHISNGKLLSCSSDNTMCVWTFSPSRSEPGERDSSPGKLRKRVRRKTQVISLERDEVFYKEPHKKTPVKVIPLWGAPVKKLVCVSCLQDTLQAVDKEFWEHSWKNWNQTLLAQCEDGSIILISLVSNGVICYFQALSSSIKEAQVHMLMEYLLVTCEDGKVYIFNMIVKALERVVTGANIKSIVRKPEAHTETIEEMDPSVSDFHQLLLFNMRQNFLIRNKLPLAIEQVKIGGGDFPVLVLNIDAILKECETSADPPKYLNYVISLCTCGIEDCHGFGYLKDLLKGVLNIEENTVHAYAGVIGLDNTFSFLLPGETNNYEISEHVSASLACSEFYLLDALIHKGSSERKHITNHVTSPTHEMRNCQNADIIFLALQTLKGNYSARKALQQVMQYLNAKSKEKMFKDMLFWLGRQENKVRRKLPSGVDFLRKHGKHRVYVGLIEALACTVLGYLSIEAGALRVDYCSKLLESLKNMLSSGVRGYVVVAAYLLGKGICIWRGSLTQEHVANIIKELLMYTFSEGEEVSRAAIKALVNIAVVDTKMYLSELSGELSQYSIDTRYPVACLSSLQYFVQKKPEESYFNLLGITHVLLKALDPHDSYLRKLCIKKASEVIQILVTSLPSVDFHLEKQRLAVTSLDNLVYIFDIKVASQWKVLQGHNAPVTALAFSKAGHLLASYSSEDAALNIWKLEAGFFQGLLHGKNLKPDKIIMFRPIEVNTFTQQLNLSLLWSENDRAIMITREDGKHYNHIVN